METDDGTTDAGAPRPRMHGAALTQRRYLLALAAIVVVGVWLRAPWPEPQWTHVDERAFVLQPLGFWSGDLNPHFFNYPTAQFYLASAADYLYYLVASPLSREAFVATRYFVDPHDVIVVARWLTTVMAAATLWAAGALGRRLYGPAGGLLAGGLLAVAPLHTRFSHLAATDVPSALWTTLAVLWAVRVVTDGRLRDAGIAGALVGLAASTKYPGIAAALPVGLAVVWRWRSPRPLLVAGGAAVAALAVTSPYLWLAPAEAWAHITAMGREHMTGDGHRVSDWPPLFYVGTTLMRGLGAAAVATLAAAVAWRWRQWQRGEVILLSGVVALSLLPAVAASGFMRYAVPAAPVLAVLVARPVTRLPLPAWARVAWLVLLLAPPAWSSLQARQLLSGSDTRTQALAWVERELGDSFYLTVAPERSGAPAFLSPGIFLAREGYFLRSYDDEDLARAFRVLRDLPEAPPMTVVGQVTEVALADGDAPDVVLCVVEHPLLGPLDPDSRGLLQQPLDWVRLDPGDVDGAAFDTPDWYFLPVAGFGDVEASGPRLSLARVGAPGKAPVPTVQAYFGLRVALDDAAAAEEQGRWAEALRLYSDVLRLPYDLGDLLSATQLYDMHLRFGMAGYQQQDYQRAVASWRLCAFIRPHEAMVVRNLGAAWAAIGQYAEAVTALRRATELAPEDADAWCGLGIVLQRSDDAVAAVSALRRCARLRPGADTQSQLGWAQLQAGDPGAARDSFRRALTLDPEHPDARRGLARAGGSPAP